MARLIRHALVLLQRGRAPARRQQSTFAAGCEHPVGDKLYFASLGGCEEIGMNANLYHTQGQWLMVDLGNKMPSEHMSPGLGLLLPDISFIESRRDKLAGLVITHAHEDHIGAIPHLWPRLRCPIYATRFAANLIQAKLKETDFRDEIEWHIIEPTEPRRQVRPCPLHAHPMGSTTFHVGCSFLNA